MRGGGRLPDVLPVLAVQPPGEHGEQRQEDQHPDPEAHPRLGRRVRDVGQEGDQVGDLLVVLRLRELAADGGPELDHAALVRMPALDLLGLLGAQAGGGVEGDHGLREALPLGPLGLLDGHAARALQLVEHVRHADVREHRVVPAGRAGRVAVVAAQVGVQPVGAGAVVRRARTRGDAQVRRQRAEPGLRVVRRHRDAHRVADLRAGEQQVVLDLRVGQAEVLQPVVAHQVRAVAAEAVVDEQLGAVLQRRLVGQLLAREVVERVAAARGLGRDGRRDENGGGEHGGGPGERPDDDGRDEAGDPVGHGSEVLVCRGSVSAARR